MRYFYFICALCIALGQPLYAFEDGDSFLQRAWAYAKHFVQDFKNTLRFGHGIEATGANALKHASKEGNEALINQFATPMVAEAPLSQEAFNHILNGGAEPAGDVSRPLEADGPVKQNLALDEAREDFTTGEKAAVDIMNDANPSVPSDPNAPKPLRDAVDLIHEAEASIRHKTQATGKPMG
jgi:hypothetical protein